VGRDPLTRLPAAVGRLETVDILRGITILWIAAFHFYVDTRGGAGNVGLPAFEAATRGVMWPPWSIWPR